MTRNEELLLRSLIKESIELKIINEFDIGNLFGSKKKTADSAVEAAKKLLDGHLSGKFEKSPDVLKKAFGALPPEEQKKYAPKIKAKHGSSKKNDELSDDEIDAAQRAAGDAHDAKMAAKMK